MFRMNKKGSMAADEFMNDSVRFSFIKESNVNQSQRMVMIDDAYYMRQRKNRSSQKSIKPDYVVNSSLTTIKGELNAASQMDHLRINQKSVQLDYSSKQHSGLTIQSQISNNRRPSNFTQYNLNPGPVNPSYPSMNPNYLKPITIKLSNQSIENYVQQP